MECGDGSREKHKPAPHPRKTLPGAKRPVRSRAIKPSSPLLVTHGGVPYEGAPLSESLRGPSDPSPDKKAHRGCDVSVIAFTLYQIFRSMSRPNFLFLGVFGKPFVLTTKQMKAFKTLGILALFKIT